ncbi:glycylpeptide N-tetradecanoyltransferase [Aphanomyces cochlioides]|nr:glycylpeptide N-tetradecanoyltransferase [Aphanomyces cochlioides]
MLIVSVTRVTDTQAIMAPATKKTTFLLNWYANPYHTPIFVAKKRGFYEEEGIDLAIMETTNPSDVTEIVGSGAVNMGLKAMIHILAAKDRGINLTSMGSLLDEPPTGLIFKASQKITKFTDIVGKRVGYIGHFGKVMIDDLAKQAGLAPDSYTTVRVGMNVTDAILRGDIDTGIGFTNFQRLELEELSGEPAGMLRIDECNGLGCCCFCSVMFVASDAFYNANKELIAGFLRATRRAMDITIEYPEQAWEDMCIMNPRLRSTKRTVQVEVDGKQVSVTTGSDVYEKIFQRTLPYFSRTLLNVERDWEKVGNFCKYLHVLENEVDQHSVYSNELVPAMGKPSVDPITPGGVLNLA